MICVNKTLIDATATLENFSTSASLDAEVLLSYILKVDKAWLLAHPEAKLTFWQKIKLQILIFKRMQNYPIAYLIGSQEFYKLEFKVNKHTLVPRPESELFIDELKKINPTNQTVLDIGTGSGCLIITAAKLFSNNKFVAIDISKQALKIAKQNSNLHQVDIQFIQNNLLNKPNAISCKYDIILANLPYLTPQQMNESTIAREPKQALIAGQDGLRYYRKLLHQIHSLQYQPKYIFFEIDPKQTELLIDLIKNILPKYKVEKISDLSGKTRLLKLIK
jgi:release factor glutamine methyltransferase